MDKWPIEDELDGHSQSCDVTENQLAHCTCDWGTAELDYAARLAIVALKEISAMPHTEDLKPLLLTYPSDQRVVVKATTSMSHDARQCGRCRAKRVLRMEE